MKKNPQFLFCSALLFGLIVLQSCSKHAEKVTDLYRGTLEKNNVVMSSTAEVIISEVSKDIISVSSDYFPTFEVEIDKKRFFKSKSYISVNPNEDFRILEKGNIIFSHTDSDTYMFWGSREVNK